jgi:ATP-binding cassette subfamily C (CFTR/MRP) protein 1
MDVDGEAVTLMSTDAEGLEGIAEMFHETWAHVLEVMVGMTLLAREVVSLWLLLILLIFRKFSIPAIFAEKH